MLTPDGQNADKTDKIMLLAMWTNTLTRERSSTEDKASNKPSFISAGMGKPTFPINAHTIQVHLSYWKAVESLAKAALNASDALKEKAVIGYGDPRGDDASRQIMAQAMSRWYGAQIKSTDILFTVGGAGALRVIFETFNLMHQKMPGYRVITPFPHYTLYADNRHQLHPIDVMKEPGYRLTARSLESSIQDAYLLAEKDKKFPKVMLLCNPNNPLGTVIAEDELKRIAEVLRKYPDLHIVVDEAYAEMGFNGKKIPSFLTVAPDLSDRMILLRSATKALSAAGERMAVIMAFNPDLMGQLLDKNIGTIGHAPRSSQLAYAETMAAFTDSEHQALAQFYQPKVEYVQSRLQAMGALMPDPDYQVDGTFYILSDFSDLMGLELPEDAKRALGKTGCVTSNEELAYYLLFNDSIMLAPSSYFGMSHDNGFMRITCSGSEKELCDLMDRLESRLFQARQDKKTQLLDSIAYQLPKLKEIDEITHAALTNQLASLLDDPFTCLSLKQQNQALQNIHGMLNVSIQRNTEEGRYAAARSIQSLFRQRLAQKERANLSDEMDGHWSQFVDTLVPKESPMKAYFLAMSVSERLNLKPWVNYLNNIHNTRRPS